PPSRATRGRRRKRRRSAGHSPMPMSTRLKLAGVLRGAAFAAVATLAACQPAAEEAAAPAAPAAPAEPPPAANAMRFMALSPTAAAVTGDVAFMAGPRVNPDGPPAMRIKSNTGVTYDTVLRPGGPDEATAVDWEYVFGVPVVTASNPPPGAPSVEL